MASRKMSAAAISAETDVQVLEAELRRSEENPTEYRPSEVRRLRARLAELQGSPAANEAPASRPAARTRPARQADAPPVARTRVTRTRRTTNSAAGRPRTTETVTQSTTQVGPATAPAVQPAAAATPVPATNNIVIPPAPPVAPATTVVAHQPAAAPARDDCPPARRRTNWWWVVIGLIVALTILALLIAALMNSRPAERGTLPGLNPTVDSGPAPEPPQGPSFTTAGPSQLIVEPKPPTTDPGLGTFTLKECRRHYLRSDYDWMEFWYVDAVHGGTAPQCHDHPRDSH